MLLGVGRGRRRARPTLTFVATANAVRTWAPGRCSSTAIAPTWNLDPELLEEELERARAPGALPARSSPSTSTDSAPTTTDPDVVRRYGVPLIEDAAEALGATYRGGRPARSASARVFSFNGNKIITTSGGGMLVGDDRDVDRRARAPRHAGARSGAALRAREIGYNYRMSNLLAAVGRGQLAALPEKLARRRAVKPRYRVALRDRAGLTVMPEASLRRGNCWLTAVPSTLTNSAPTARRSASI